MPAKFKVKIQSKSHLKNSGTLPIKTQKRKQIFFDYKIDASLFVFKARKNIVKFRPKLIKEKYMAWATARHILVDSETKCSELKTQINA